jgi:hypothetical protein
MTLLEVGQKYGNSREALVVGDRVLLEGSDSTNGTYVFLCEVIAITGANARLRELETYYLSGNVFPRSGEMDCPVAYFKDSIVTRLAKQNEFLSWFAEALCE